MYLLGRTNKHRQIYGDYSFKISQIELRRQGKYDE